MYEIKFKKLVPNAQMPTRKYDVDAGFDFYCTAVIKKSKYIEYHTGIALEIPEGMVGLAFPRSSVIYKDLVLKNSVGVITASNRDEIIFIYNDTKQYTAIQKKDFYEVGECIGQIIFMELPNISMIEVNEINEYIA